MITEKNMGIGGFDIQLTPDTPGSVLSQIQVNDPGVGFSHIVITPTRVDPSVLTDADMMALSRYTGVYRSQPDPLTLSGAGVNMWVADEDGKGAVYNTGVSTAGGTLPQWVALLKPAGIASGILVNPGGTFAQVYGPTNLWDPLLEVRRYFNVNWRITPDLKFDIGPMASLYKVTPTAVIVKREGDGGRDLNISGIVGDMNIARDVEDWVRRVNYFTGSAGSPTVSTADGGVADNDVAYRAPDGTAIRIDQFVIDYGSTPTAAGPGLAAAEYLKNSAPRREFTLKNTQYDIGADVAVGDNLYVYDPTNGIQDLNNPVGYRGQTIYPDVIRCEGYTWPLRHGMGVYLRKRTPGGPVWPVRWIDLSDYVIPDSGETSIQIGAAPRVK